MKATRIPRTAWLVPTLVAASAAMGETRYVWRDNPSPSPPYTNWATAAQTIQDAIDAAAGGDVILVTNGVYDTGGRVIHGAMTNRVAIGKAVAVRSVNGPAATAIVGSGPPGNAAVRCAYIGTNATLAGFLLTNGSTRMAGDWDREQSGGGSWCEPSGALTNCVLTSNSASYCGGGAAFGLLLGCTLAGNNAADSGGGSYDSTLTNCALSGNSAYYYGGAAYLGTFDHCGLSNNAADSGGATYGATLHDCALAGNTAGDGGGAYDCTLNDCTLTGNTADYGGGACYGTLTNCTLSGNSASYEGGGTHNNTLNGCTLSANSAPYGGGAYWGVLVNCLLADNIAAAYGGGAYDSSLGRCTLASNSADSGGGICYGAATSCVFRGNLAAYGGGAYYAAPLVNGTLAGNTATNEGGGAYYGRLTNCIAYYNTAPAGSDYSGGSLGHCCAAPLPAGIGNLAGEPQFVSLAAGNLRLLAASPCLDAGTNRPWMAAAVDLDSQPRIFHDVVDMGAYEYQGAANPDADGDGLPDDWEIAHGLNPAVSNAPDADADGDAFTDWQEYVADTEPTNPASLFGPLWLYSGSPGLPWTSTGRVYYLDGSANYVVPDWQVLTTFTGVGGPFVFPAAKTNATGLFRARVCPTNLPPEPLPPLVSIPGNSFVMGACTNVGQEANGDEVPQHTVTISFFHMDRYEVKQGLWAEVKVYSLTNGYGYSNPGAGKSAHHPVHSVNWFDAVKWCNARSVKEGLVPVYYADAGFTTVYKTGELVPYANWSASGYRLPTEAEWEMAARGGAADTRFPWTDYSNNISHAKANYYGTLTNYTYDLSKGYHPAYTNTGYPYTSPVGSFPTNGYGLCDMAGNVMEWCWDWYQSDYYGRSPATDPRGPDEPVWGDRVLRGGAWGYQAREARCAFRSTASPDYFDNNTGFRCVRRP